MDWQPVHVGGTCLMAKRVSLHGTQAGPAPSAFLSGCLTLLPHNQRIYLSSHEERKAGSRQLPFVLCLSYSAFQKIYQMKNEK